MTDPVKMITLFPVSCMLLGVCWKLSEIFLIPVVVDSKGKNAYANDKLYKYVVWEWYQYS